MGAGLGLALTSSTGSLIPSPPLTLLPVSLSFCLSLRLSLCPLLDCIHRMCADLNLPFTCLSQSAAHLSACLFLLSVYCVYMKNVFWLFLLSIFLSISKACLFLVTVFLSISAACLFLPSLSDLYLQDVFWRLFLLSGFLVRVCRTSSGGCFCCHVFLSESAGRLLAAVSAVVFSCPSLQNIFHLYMKSKSAYSLTVSAVYLLYCITVYLFCNLIHCTLLNL